MNSEASSSSEAQNAKDYWSLRTFETAEKLAAERKLMDLIFEHCKVVYFPKDGSYPIEHAKGANKDSREMLLAQLQKDHPETPKP